MCIISGQVNSVGATKIFAIPSRSGTRQLTAYTNTVDTPADNLMCLPVPNPDTVEFEKVPADLFQQCAQSFQVMISREITLGVSRSLLTSSNELIIQSHGSYDVVLIPSLNDMGRIPRHFATLTSDVIQFMQRNYAANMGFLLCRLKPGKTSYEPFAYSHAISGPYLFVPTMHFHTHAPATHAHWERPWSGEAWNPRATSDADWDHLIYTAHTPVAAHRSSSRIPKDHNMINWREISDEFNLGKDTQLRCMEITGSSEGNHDIVLPLVA